MASSLDVVHIPGIGDVHAGLDWLVVNQMDGVKSEIKRLASSHEAAWYFLFKQAEEENCFVAFASKEQSKKPPIAGAALITKVLKEESEFICLLRLDEDRYWLLSVENGLPTTLNQSADYVAGASDISEVLRNIIGSLQKPGDMPVYTDCDDIVSNILFDLDVRPFSLEVLGESLTKKDVSKVKFQRYTTVPIVGISIFFLIFCFSAAGAWYWVDARNNDLKIAAKKKKQELTRRKNELAQQVDDAINSRPLARQTLELYLSAVGKVPPKISGWQLELTTCENSQCMLTYKARSFATWSGYLSKKPKNWPDPIFGADVGVVYQPIPLSLPDAVRRDAKDLPIKSDLIFEFGNLAQLSKELGVNLKLEGEPFRVAGDGNDSWIPLKARFNGSGPVELLSGIIPRLPASAGVTTLDFRIAEKVTFEITGEIYANP